MQDIFSPTKNTEEIVKITASEIGEYKEIVNSNYLLMKKIFVLSMYLHIVA